MHTAINKPLFSDTIIQLDANKVLYTLDDAGNRTTAVIDLNPPAVTSFVAPQSQSQAASQPTKLPLSQGTSSEPEGTSGVKENE